MNIIRLPKGQEFTIEWHRLACRRRVLVNRLKAIKARHFPLEVTMIPSGRRVLIAIADVDLKLDQLRL